MKHTVKYWIDKEDFDKGEAQIVGDDFLFQPAMDKMLELYYGDKMYAVEVFETISGETKFHTDEL